MNKAVNQVGTGPANGTGQVVLQVNGVTKQIGHKKIVDRLSFDIHQGEIVGLLGPNGAGKTTTIRMIVGLIGMSEGDVLIKGESVKRHFAKAIAHVGGIIENPEFYPYMTGYDNLKQYQRMAKGVTEERIAEVVRLVGLQDAMKKRVKAYSLGMRQRLGIAQALLHNPSILILDEPTNGLDPAGIREMRDYLKRIAREEGIAILVSSHLLSEMELMCSRVVVIQEGKLVTVRTLGDSSAVKEEEQIQVMLRVNDAEQAKLRLVRMEELRVVGIDTDRNQVTIAVHDRDIPNVIDVLRNEGVALYRIEEMKESLEDEFLKWTGGSQSA
ncbi:ABC transporter ATP-binding protein [Paenibacillus motobuensis]|uniref:ABC transporter ATP-binding protein n=1 Tax=Paenibacillus TaxID=44249 RepID=UPI00203C9924|nr:MULTISPECIES: ABC transporter ATP-binding protein [Paenibacillus]MCM3042402.1 ABC transporter ATP-binding protein [Paenibacillus lutimineralis]MCM3649506.1 ABC transporter ATP-binding protein [Paenibacillus motobuensis]